LFDNIIDWEYWDISLDLKLDDFYDKDIETNILLNWLVEDFEKYKIIFKSIFNFLIKNDIQEFYNQFIKKYIIKYNVERDIISVKDFREKFWIKDSYIKNALEILVKESFLKRAKWFWRYKVL
jgi:hypothetical protein